MRIALLVAVLMSGPLLVGVQAAQLPEPGTIENLGIYVHTADPS